MFAGIDFAREPAFIAPWIFTSGIAGFFKPEPDMMRYRKPILIGLIALIAVFFGIKIARAVYPLIVKARLNHAISKIEPWTISTSYSDAAWKKLVNAAKRFQSADPKLAKQVIANRIKTASANPNQLAIEQGKIFLLSRVVFDLPGNGSQRIPGAGWERGQTDVNPDGTINAAWPVVWNGGKPSLASGRVGNAGSYSATNEFEFLRFRYKYRDLSTFGG
ncbi:MAG TPA: hypothetical protein VFM25_13875 [Verrucomicrobiae bacterium]|nr:hypothetical protein [Verrucomicrobiae bacterium]